VARPTHCRDAPRGVSEAAKPVQETSTPVVEIEEEAAAARKRDGVQVAGADAVLAHHPHDRPEKLKKGPAPLFHAATAEMRKFLWTLYAEFVGRFRDAAEKLRAGDREAAFPRGCFPPALPFVPG
jgi:hypothetical protein